MKTMKSVIILAGILVLAATAQADVVSPFIRAGLDFSKLNALDSIKGKAPMKEKLSGWDTGYFAEAGIKFLGSHTLAVEAGYLKASGTVGAEESGVQSREQIPLLLNYRYSFNLGPASLYLGASAGLMSDKAKWRDDVKGVNSWEDFKDANWVGLYGATAGVGMKLGKHWGIDVGVRALAVSEKQYQDGNLADATETSKIGGSKVYWRPNVRLALTLQW